MREFIKKVYIVLILAMITTFITFSYTAHAFQVEDRFFMKDISDHWAQEGIQELAYMGILNGDDNSNANPDQSITRAEFVALLVRTLNYEENIANQEAEFKDVQKTDWYYNTVAVAKQNGIIKGSGDGYFLPNHKVTREEIVLMLVRAMGLKEKSIDINFKDIDKNYLYQKELKAAVSSNIISGYTDDTFRPYHHATRAEAAVMIQRILYISDPFIYAEEDTIRLLVKKYLNEYLQDKNNRNSALTFNFDHSVGKEESDNQAKAQIIELYKTKGVRVKENIDNLDIEINQITNYLANAVVNYDATYIRNFSNSSERIKTYKVEAQFSLRKVANKWKVYDIKERLYQDEKINLTWEQISVKTPDMSGVQDMKELDVIVPTWFELRKSNSALGVTAQDPVVYKDWQTSIHMVDIGEEHFMEWAHENDHDVWAMFRNEFDIEVANKMLNSKEARRKSIELLVEYVNKYKLDGINVDFENVYYSDRHVLSQFVRELALVLREQGVLTSVDVTKIEPTSWTWSMCYDREALGEAADYIALMAYDQNGTWSKISGSVAQYSWVENGLKGVLSQVPNEKVLLGVPFYTRVWEEVNGRVTSTKAISMQRAKDLIASNNANVRWDSKSGQYLAVYQKAGKTYKIWVEDAESINLKSSLVHKYDLAGVASWRRGFETPDIWNILYNNLKEISSYDEWLSIQ